MNPVVFAIMVCVLVFAGILTVAAFAIDALIQRHISRRKPKNDLRRIT